MATKKICDGCKVKILAEPNEFFSKFIWEVIGLSTNIHKNGETMYLCVPILQDGGRGTVYQFTKNELELL